MSSCVGLSGPDASAGRRPSEASSTASGTAPSARTRPPRRAHWGGLRRKREGTVAGAYELEGLASIPALRRILEIVAVDTLSLDNGTAR